MGLNLGMFVFSTSKAEVMRDEVDARRPLVAVLAFATWSWRLLGVRRCSVLPAPRTPRDSAALHFGFCF